MKNPLAWLAGAVVLYLATRPRHVGNLEVPEGGRTGSIDGHTTLPHPTPALPICPSGTYQWDGNCLSWDELPESRRAELIRALSQTIQ